MVSSWFYMYVCNEKKYAIMYYEEEVHDVLKSYLMIIKIKCSLKDIPNNRETNYMGLTSSNLVCYYKKFSSFT